MTEHVRLRGHHLICLNFYRGEGYDARFVDNLWEIVEALPGAVIEVVEGADDVCAACPDLRDGACASADVGEAAAERLDGLALGLLGGKAGDAIVWAALRERLPDVLPAWRESACGECGWRDICGPMMDLKAR